VSGSPPTTALAGWTGSGAMAGVADTLETDDPHAARTAAATTNVDSDLPRCMRSTVAMGDLSAGRAPD
jgi:hypothetical protein